MHDRKELRRALRARRASLDIAAREHAAAALRTQVNNLDCYRKAQHLAAYVAVAGEMDPGPLLREALARGKQIYLPRIPLHHPGVLQFFSWTPGAAMPLNRLGIPEPAATDSSRIEPEMLDLVLVPLLAFDGQGHRLGMGGGYYDRSFAFLKNGSRRPILLGLAYEFQRLEHIPQEPWDVPLDGVVTENRSYLFPKESPRT